MIKNYYALTKPGIIYGNGVATAAGFALASHAHFDTVLFIATLVGISFIIASGCVFNNYIDRDIDALMERTKKRALVTGAISPTRALIFASTLGFLGAFNLAVFTNLLTLFLAVIGLFFYVVVYSMWSKRHTIHATLIGAISGAVPPVVGYCAVSNSFDTGAQILFLILAAWQIPHALAIAIYRYQDYASASVPVLPVAKGMNITKTIMTLYVAAYVLAIMSLWLFGYASLWLAIALGLLGVSWLAYSVAGFWTQDDSKWGRKMFRYSLISLLSFCVAVAVDAVFARI